METLTEFLNYIGYEYPEDRKRDDNPLWLLGIPCKKQIIFPHFSEK